MGGDSGSQNLTDFALARYLQDGALDPTFDRDGKVTTIVGSFDMLLALALQPDGKIVAAGTGHERSEFAVVRYEPNGGLDTTFDEDGMLTTDFGSPVGFQEAVRDVAVQADGKIVVAGNARSSDSGDFAIARYNVNGTLDSDFGTGGRVVTTLATTTSSLLLC